MKKSVFNLLKESTNAKKVIRAFLCLLLGLYVFAIPSFSGRELFNYFYYMVFALKKRLCMNRTAKLQNFSQTGQISR